MSGGDAGVGARRTTSIGRWTGTLGAIVLVVGAAGCTDAGIATPTRPAVSAAASAAPIATATPLAEPDATATTEAAALPDRTVEESGGFRLTTLSSSSCLAEGPADWSMTAPEASNRADLLSPDGSLYAGYGIQAINTTLQGFAATYQPPLDDPGLYSTDTASVAAAYGRIIVSAIGGSSDLAVEELYEPTPDYLLMTVSTSTHRGVIFFRGTGIPGDGFNYTYALPMYFAFTTAERWDQEGLLVARVSASIRCSTQLQPPEDYPIVEAREDGGTADANGDDAGYNPQLGTEPAHDPTTGENYLVDPSVNWSESGPDGPGYYVPKSGGNDYQKLDPGRSD